MQPETVAHALVLAQQRLSLAGIASARLDARLIVQHVTRLSHEQVIASPERTLRDEEKVRIGRLVLRREAHEPVSRLTGEREFYGRSFRLNHATLDPRPDTETLVEAAISVVRLKNPSGSGVLVADIGTGTGAIAISLLAELTNARAKASDISRSALRMARENSLRHKVADRLELVHGRWFDNIAGVFDLVVSNPPYIPAGELASLPEEVRGHDPEQALNGGPDGLDAFREIGKAVRRHLRIGGHVCLEIGKGQEEKVMQIMIESGLKPACKVGPLTPDLCGITRVLTFVND